MARAGISKMDVQRARQAVLATGKHPSIDAIRIQLGNTGSKATIFRFLKEMEADGEVMRTAAQGSLSEELQALVASLAERLEFESQQLVEIQRMGHLAEVGKLQDAAERARAEAQASRREAERLQTELAQEKVTRQAQSEELANLRVEHAQLATQLAGTREQLNAAAAHAGSLDESHRHAREALEHFRTASKEQRDREARQHEQQVQHLQKELAASIETVTIKQHELRTALQEKVDALAVLTAIRTEKHQLEEQVRDRKQLAERLGAQTRLVEELRAQSAHAVQNAEGLTARSAELVQRNLELERQLAGATATAQAQELLMKDVLTRISKPDRKPAAKAG